MRVVPHGPLTHADTLAPGAGIRAPRGRRRRHRHGRRSPRPPSPPSGAAPPTSPSPPSTARPPNPAPVSMPMPPPASPIPTSSASSSGTARPAPWRSPSPVRSPAPGAPTSWARSSRSSAHARPLPRRRPAPLARRHRRPAPLRSLHPLPRPGRRPQTNPRPRQPAVGVGDGALGEQGRIGKGCRELPRQRRRHRSPDRSPAASVRPSGIAAMLFTLAPSTNYRIEYRGRTQGVHTVHSPAKPFNSLPYPPVVGCQRACPPRMRAGSADLLPGPLSRRAARGRDDAILEYVKEIVQALTNYNTLSVRDRYFINAGSSTRSAM